MDVFEAIFKRRSVRNYLEVPVEWEKIGYILEAGRAAPSAGNLQSWKFIVCTRGDQRKALASAALNQRWMETAPVHIVVCAEPKRVEIFYGIRGERLYSVQNCAAAIQNMMLAAYAQGLGSCWIGAFDEDMVKSTCNVPDYGRPQAILTIGYPAGETKDPGRAAVYSVTFIGGYHSRIRDFNKVMGFHSHKVQKAFTAGKEMIEHGSGRLDRFLEKSRGLFRKDKE